MDLNAELFDKICRVCLIQSAGLKSLFGKIDGEERNLLEVLAFTANIDIKIEDNLPKQVCVTCESIMCKADAFKRRCLESETILNNVNHNASREFTSSATVQNLEIKDDKNELKQKLSEYGTFVSSIPGNNISKYDFDKKDTVLENVSISPTSADSTLSKLFNSQLIQVKQLKIEPINKFDDGNDWDFDNEGQIEISMDKIEEKIEPKKLQKKLKNIVIKKAKLTKKMPIKYQCYCGLIFVSKEKYKSHLNEKECESFKIVKFGKNKIKLKYPLNCPKCNIELNSPHAYKKHERSHHNENTDDNPTLYQCSYCLRKFKHKVSLEAHIQRHEESINVKYVCEICKREFRYKAYLDNHIVTTHSKSNGLTCEVCSQSFGGTEALEVHKKSHENEKKHRCTTCNKAFLMLCTLKEHMRTHTGEKPFLCSQCGKGFSQKTNLGQHMRRHQGYKPFKCETCQKGFVSKGELEAHTRKHSGAHPFVCDDCGNGFTTSSALVKHRRTHTGERPYLCDLCPMRFAASGTLKNHRRTHTGERPFQCSYCDKAFVQRNDLVSHIRCHTGERPYVCNQCGQSFRKASGLKTHIKLHIKDPIVGVNALLTGMHCSEA